MAVFTFSYDLWFTGHKQQSVKPLIYSSGHICHLQWAGSDIEKEHLSMHRARSCSCHHFQSTTDDEPLSFQLPHDQSAAFDHFYFLALLFFWRLPSSVEKGSSSGDHRCLLSPFWEHHRYTGACDGKCTVFVGEMASASNKWTRLQRYLYFREGYTDESLLNFDSKGKY